MAELVYACGSEPYGVKSLQVQVLLFARNCHINTIKKRIPKHNRFCYGIMVFFFYVF